MCTPLFSGVLVLTLTVFYIAAADEYGVATSGRVQVNRQNENRCHSYGSGPDSDTNVTEAWCGWEVCGILRLVVLFSLLYDVQLVRHDNNVKINVTLKLDVHSFELQVILDVVCR